MQCMCLVSAPFSIQYWIWGNTRKNFAGCCYSLWDVGISVHSLAIGRWWSWIVGRSAVEQTCQLSFRTWMESMESGVLPGDLRTKTPLESHSEIGRQASMCGTVYVYTCFLRISAEIIVTGHHGTSLSIRIINMHWLTLTYDYYISIIISQPSMEDIIRHSQNLVNHH